MQRHFPARHPAIKTHRIHLTATRIAIIVRTKDRPQLLTRCLRSLAEQKRCPDEVIIVNDGGQPVDQVIHLFNTLNIQLIDNENNLGRAAAGNQGVAAAQSDVIGFLDDDDRYLSDHLQRLEKALQLFDTKVVYSGCYLIQRDLLGDTVVLQEKPIGQFNDTFQAERLQYENYIPLINLLINRDLWLKIGGFDESFNLFEDWDVLLRLSQQTPFYHVNRMTTEYAVWGAQQITRASEKQRWIQAYRQILAKHFTALPSQTQLDYLAEYWHLSQERRGNVAENHQEIQQLQSKLLETQHTLAQFESYKQHYDNLQQHHQQLQVEKDRQHQEWQEHYARLETEWQQRYAHLETEWQQRVTQLRTEQEQQLSQIHTDYQKEVQLWQTELKKQQINWQINYYNKETELLQQISQLEKQYQQQQAESLQLKQFIPNLQASLHDCSRRISLGLNQATMERILTTQPPVYKNLINADAIRFNYQRLVDWCEEKNHQLTVIQQQFYSKTLSNLQDELMLLRKQLHQITEKAVKSRWLHYGGYVKLLDKINLTSDNLSIQINNYLTQIAQPKSAIYETLPTPRQLSELYPSIITFAKKSSELQIMQHTEQRGDIIFHLGMHDTLAFTVYCSHAAFCRIDIAMATYVRINACHLRIIIREMGQTEILRLIHFSAMIILDNLFHPVTFEPLIDSMGKTYQIEIDSPDSSDHNAVAIWCQSAPPLPQQLRQVPIEQTISTLPSWLQENIVEIPLANCLISEQSCTHLFLISGVDSLLSLYLFLRKLAHALNQVSRQAKVVITGKIDETVKNYCQQHKILTFPQTDFAKLLDQLQQNNFVKSIDYTWFCHINAIPQLETIQQAEEIFYNQANAALLVPLQILPNAQIGAAYALIGTIGELHHFPIEMPANHPYHGYRRTIQAASNHLIILKNQVIQQIDVAALSNYQTPCYQVTELIWQLQAQQLMSFYDSACAYQVTQPIYTIDENACTQDRKLFFNHWQLQLAHQADLNGSFLLNPRQLPTILIVDATLPTYDEDSGSLRIFTIMKLLIQLGYKVSFFPDNLDSCFKYRHALEALGIEVFHGQYTIGDALSYRIFDFAMVCRVDIGHRYIPFIRLMSPKTKIFYDTVDIHYIREFRQAEIENNPQLAENAKETKRKELSNCLLSDLTLTVTEEDGKHLQQELPQLSFAVLPNVHESYPVAVTDFAQRDGLVFIGNYNHQPNEDAVFYFVEHVLPKIHLRLPKVKLYLIGSNMKEKMKKLANEYIQVIGWVDKVEPEFEKRRLFISYLRYGAGMKGKLGQALSLGLPVVTTNIGAEGMGLIEGETALIADEAEQFAQAVCRLYEDEVLWQKLAQQGRDFIEQRYGETAISQQLKWLFFTT